MASNEYIRSKNKNLASYFEVHYNNDLTSIKSMLTNLLLEIMDQYQKHLSACKLEREEIADVIDNELAIMAEVEAKFFKEMETTKTLNKGQYLEYVYEFGFGNLILDNALYTALITFIKKDFYDNKWKKLMYGTKPMPAITFLYHLNDGQINTGVLEIDIEPLVEILEIFTHSNDLFDKINTLKKFVLVLDNYPDDDVKAFNLLYQDALVNLINKLEYYYHGESAKGYGQYPGAFNEMSYYLNTCGELELFMLINDKAGYIRFLRDDFRDAGEHYLNISEEYCALDYAVMQTKRFGVEIEMPKQGRVSKKGQFSDWFKWWHQYVYQELTEKDRKKIEEVMEEGHSLSEYRPKGTWKQFVKII